VTTVGIVACCGPKLAFSARAEDLYTSDLFRKSVAYLERLGISQWAILSAKHGLVRPDRVIRPYDKALARMPASERRKWAKKVQNQLVSAFEPGTHFVVLGGRHYLAPFDGLVDYTYEDPLRGMQIGERLRFLKGAGK
jgi:hypothetical protein